MIKTFEYLINTGVSAVEGIVDAKERAMVCAELAKAVAMSGVLKASDVDESISPADIEKPEKEAKKGSKSSKSNKKEALKTENQKKETATPVEEAAPVDEPEVPQAPVEEEVVETPAPAQEVEIVDEWTEEMQQLKAEQLEILNSYVEAWGDEYVYNDCLGCFTENTLVGAENVRPSNIDGFVVYLNELAQQFAQE